MLCKETFIWLKWSLASIGKYYQHREILRSKCYVSRLTAVGYKATKEISLSCPPSKWLIFSDSILTPLETVNWLLQLSKSLRRCSGSDRINKLIHSNFYKMHKTITLNLDISHRRSSCHSSFKDKLMFGSELCTTLLATSMEWSNSTRHWSLRLW